MGNKTTKMTTTTTTSALTSEQLAEGNDGKVYALLKRRPGCTGMFWRQDPTRTNILSSNADWPRDGARLRGMVVTDKHGEMWLVASHVQQRGGPWKMAPSGSAMPFEYDNHYYLEEVKEGV